MGNADMAAHWVSRLHSLATQARVNGATLGVWSDGQESVAVHGVLSTATQVTTTPGSLFQIGSITKVWTATMIMQLIDEGKLSLDTTVAAVLPGARLGVPDASGEVTVGHLLTHTSGIDGDIFTDTGRGGHCIGRYVDRLAQAARIYPPGAAYSYCNSGFVLLGRIIEVLDGHEWDVCLRQRLTGPLGLAHTVVLPEHAILHRTATGHRPHPHESDTVSIWGLPRSLGPAGLITASAHDLLAFARFHLGGGLAPDGTRLLSGSALAAMREARRRVPGGGRADAVGLAWRLFDWGGRQIIGHDGGTIGQSAYLRIDPQAGVAVCLLTNSPEADALYQRLFSEIFSACAGVTVPPGPAPAREPLELAGLERHAGRYERSSRRLDVFHTDGRLRLVSTMTGDRAVFADDQTEELTLYPADATGDSFVCRSLERDPWTSVSFGRLAGGTPYIYLGGRVTPRTA